MGEKENIFHYLNINSFMVSIDSSQKLKKSINP